MQVRKLTLLDIILWTTCGDVTLGDVTLGGVTQGRQSHGDIHRCIINNTYFHVVVKPE